MAFVVTKVEDKRNILIEFEGRVTVSDLEKSREALKAILAESDKYRTSLVDMRRANLDVSTIDIHDFILSQKSELPDGFLVAIIVQQKDWGNAIFAETVAYNRGFSLRAFQNSTLAYDWLGIGDEK
jgi:hypothetical protein